ncbi:hypothetical protein GOBAR_AA17260 [Gossypium barbadense]|uniref:Uncharacterized protein n=1 Tax=Gossypium barbadense TaxID=3634 RepID=A0A2P5XJB3_GOSBA|nr:hypothetical protein GOBAR_AA17260 [Gossypium barbadense]
MAVAVGLSKGWPVGEGKEILATRFRVFGEGDDEGMCYLDCTMWEDVHYHEGNRSVFAIHLVHRPEVFVLHRLVLCCYLNMAHECSSNVFPAKKVAPHD